MNPNLCARISPRGEKCGLAIVFLAGAVPTSFSEFVPQAEFNCTSQAAAVSDARIEAIVPEAQRIGALLNACSRPKDVGGREDYLYTWGYKAKLEKMLGMSRMEYCNYDQARLQTFLTLANTTVTQSGEPLQFMEEALANITRNFFEIPSDSYYDELVGHEDQALIDTFTQAKESCAGPVCRAHYEGRLDGIAQKKRTTRKNTSTFGLGVSFSNNPLEAIEHLYDEDHRGIVCNIVNDNAPIVDFFSAENNHLLETKKVRLNNSNPGKEFAANVMLLPYYNPVAFENASHNRLLRVQSKTPVYLDKCHIEYRSSCQYLTVDSLDDCKTLGFLNHVFENFMEDADVQEKAVLDNTTIKVEDVKTLGRYLQEQSHLANTPTMIAALRERWLTRCALPQDHPTPGIPGVD